MTPVEILSEEFPNSPRSPLPAPLHSRALDRLLIAILALCLIRLWAMPLGSSLWVDEMGTAFVIHHGAADPSLRAAPQVADSVYYFLPALAVRLVGNSEFALRFFSLLAMAAALFAIWSLSARLIHPHSTWLAVFGCLAVRGFDYQASDARPYALGTCVLTLSILFLVRWMETHRLRDAVLFAAAASLLWWVHLLFWPFYLLFVAYTVASLWRGRSFDHWWQALAVFSVIAVLCLPTMATALALAHQATAHVVAPLPAWNDLGVELKFATITAACTLAFLASRYWHWHAPRFSMSRPGLVLILGWRLVDPLALYSYSRMSGNSVFVARYLYLAIPGAILTAIVLVAMIVPAPRLKPAAVALGIVVLVFTGHWNRLWPQHTRSDWRAASAALQSWVASDPEPVPVLCPSPFIEARPPVWSPESDATGFLYSNLAYYPVSGQPIAFPYEPSDTAEARARDLASGMLSHTRRFAIYGGDHNVRFWREWFAARPELENFQSRTLGTFGDVEIAIFTLGPS